MSEKKKKRPSIEPLKRKGLSIPKCRYIRSLQLENVRTFRSKAKLDCCFPDGNLAQWTIILGENGTGKTTLLQYIAGMIPIRDAVPQSEKDGSLIKYRLRPSMSQGSFIDWHYGNLSHPKDLPKQLCANMWLSTPASALKDATADAENRPKGEAGLEVEFLVPKDESLRVNVRYTAQNDERNDRTFEQFFLIGYGAGRHVAGPGSPYLSSESAFDSPIGTIFEDDRPLMSPEQWLLSLDHQSKGDDPVNKIAASALERAKACLCKVLPNVTEITVEPFGRRNSIGPYGPAQPSMTVLFETPYGPVQFAGLSLGYRAMASWIIDFVRRMHLRYPQLPEPEKGAAVVLIDEFDLHMHVRWQMEMIDHLSRSFPNTQFIITAHSPLIIQAADGRANIAVLERVAGKDGNDEVVIRNDPSYVRGWRIDQIITSDLYGMDSSRSKTYADLMNRRRVLLQKENLDKGELEELDQLTERLSKEAPPDKSSAQEWLEHQLREAGVTQPRKGRKLAL